MKRRWLVWMAALAGLTARGDAQGCSQPKPELCVGHRHALPVRDEVHPGSRGMRRAPVLGRMAVERVGMQAHSPDENGDQLPDEGRKRVAIQTAEFGDCPLRRRHDRPEPGSERVRDRSSRRASRMTTTSARYRRSRRGGGAARRRGVALAKVAPAVKVTAALAEQAVVVALRAWRGWCRRGWCWRRRRRRWWRRRRSGAGGAGEGGAGDDGAGEGGAGEDGAGEGGEPPLEPGSRKLEWSNLRVYVTAANLGNQFEAEVTYPEESCTARCAVCRRALAAGRLWEMAGNPMTRSARTPSQASRRSSQEVRGGGPRAGRDRSLLRARLGVDPRLQVDSPAGATPIAAPALLRLPLPSPPRRRPRSAGSRRGLDGQPRQRRAAGPARDPELVVSAHRRDARPSAAGSPDTMARLDLVPVRTGEHRLRAGAAPRAAPRSARRASGRDRRPAPTSRPTRSGRPRRPRAARRRCARRRTAAWDRSAHVGGERAPPRDPPEQIVFHAGDLAVVAPRTPPP